MVLWEQGSESGLSGCENGDNLGGFPGVGEISETQNMIKNLGQVDKSSAGEISKHSS
jgi:hypothetical protein